MKGEAESLRRGLAGRDMRGKHPDSHPVSGSPPQGCSTPALKLVLEKVLLTKHNITNLRAANSKSIYSSVSCPEGSGYRYAGSVLSPADRRMAVRVPGFVFSPSST